MNKISQKLREIADELDKDKPEEGSSKTYEIDTLSNIESVNWDYKYINSDYPSSQKVEVLSFDKVITTQEVLDRNKKDGYEFLSFSEAIEFAKKYSDDFKGNALVVLKEINGQLWYLCVIVDSGGGLEVDVDRRDLGDDWGGDVRFVRRPKVS